MQRARSPMHPTFRRILHCAVVIAAVAVMVPVGMPSANAIPPTAETYWVNASNGLDAPGHGTQAEPFATITYAVSVSDSADTIMVEPGDYVEANNEVFPIVLNGQSLRSTGGSAVTTIDVTTTNTTNTKQLLAINGWGAGDVLEGFTIRDGGVFGGASAVSVNLSSPTTSPNEPRVKGCEFFNCSGTTGGALQVFGGVGTTLVIEDNAFENCSAGSGGAVGVTTYSSVVLRVNDFISNAAGSRGGALSVCTGTGGAVTVLDNNFDSNDASNGGAIYWSGVPSAPHLVQGNFFISNAATPGGALYLLDITAAVTRNEASANTAGVGMAGFAYLENADVTASGNYIHGSAAAINGSVWVVDPNSSLAEANDTVSGSAGGAPYATYAAAPGLLTVLNCIYWNPGPVTELYSANVAYSCSQDGESTLITAGNSLGAGMVYSDPLISSTSPPTLLPASPCIETGSPIGGAPYDIYGTPIPQDADGDRVARADIGCYEVPGVPLPTLYPVYRFYNVTNNTHFFTNSAEEADHVIATWPSIYRYEGPAYHTNPANNTQALYRFYNKVSGSHFYTASAEEAAHILATWPNVFSLDGQTYAVNPAPVPWSTPVYRFYNLRNGSHFYTASAEEADMVIATWPDVYRFEGPAFWIGL